MVTSRCRVALLSQQSEFGLEDAAFADSEAPTERVKVDTQERAEVPCPVAILLGDSKLAAFGL